MITKQKYNELDMTSEIIIKLVNNCFNYIEGSKVNSANYLIEFPNSNYDLEFLKELKDFTKDLKVYMIPRVNNLKNIIIERIKDE